LTPEHEAMPDLEVRIPQGNNEDISITQDIPIVLREGKR